MKIRIRYEKRGGHFHCSVFSSHRNDNWAKIGDLCIDEEDFSAMAYEHVEIEMIEKGKPLESGFKVETR